MGCANNGQNSHYLDLIGSVTQQNWRSIGPASASKDVTWARMSSLPSNTKAVVLKFACDLSGASSPAFAYVRDTSSAEAVGLDNMVFYSSQTASTAAGVGYATVAMDSAPSLEMYWYGGGYSSGDYRVYLVGYYV